jgi:hypothetical protein
MNEWIDGQIKAICHDILQFWISFVSVQAQFCYYNKINGEYACTHFPETQA